ncbi:MAG: N-acetylglucosamine-6-phosphate deacetylase [Erysipelotrichaceae bacterium]|nr:N-acetylglucosamine-6-phosphate deacetylase [Erysipelotrichaceae bacterium]
MIIQSKRVYFEEKLQPRQIEIRKDRIVGVYPYGQFKADKDYEDLIVMPGLCDVHNHGYNGYEANTATRKWLKEWTAYLPSEGVTSTLASISSFPKEGLLKALKIIGSFIDNDNKTGTHILGVYEEGPFISSGKERGAQNLAFQIIPTRKIIDEFNRACNGHLIYVMIAPEMLKGNYSVIDYCISKGMKVALGHTGATFDICKEAIKHGAISFTHTYNGMKGLHHREPGVVGAAMYFDECYAECICDGIHVNRIAANVLAKTKGKDKLILITDSVSIKGFKPGVYELEEKGRTTTVTDKGVAYITGTDTLAGSCHRLNHILDYAIHEAGIDPVTAMNAATINPMKMLGINDRGLIKENYYADLAVFDDRFNTKATYIDGKEFAFRKK